MSESKIPEKIKESIIDSNELISNNDLIKKFNIKRITATNYLSRLEKDGLITRIGRGEYISFKKSQLKPEIDQETGKIFQILKKSSPFLEFIIWSIFNLKAFFHNIPLRNYIFVEAEEIFELKSIKERLFEKGFESIINPKTGDFKELSFRNETPIFLFKRKNLYGIIDIEDVKTATSERCFLDLYYYITRKDLMFPIEELKTMLINMIQTREFNFSFAMRYAKIRNFEFELLLIISKLDKELQNLIPNIYPEKILKLNKNMSQFFNNKWADGIL